MNVWTSTSPTRSGRAPGPPGMAALLGSIFLVDLGIAMTGVAMPLLLFQKYGITLAVGLTMAIRLIPSILAGPLVGTLIARSDPRRIAVTSALCCGVLVAMVPFTDSLWQIQLLGLANGVAGMFAGPARLVLRPRVIKEGEELHGNGLLVAAERVPGLLGPALVGLLVALADLRAAFFVEAVASAVAAVLVLRIPAAVAEPAGEDGGQEPAERTAAGMLRGLLRSYGENTRGLVRVASQDRYLCGLTVTAFTYVAAVSVGRFVLIQIGADEFDRIPGFFGYLVGAMAAGGVVGGLLAGRLGRFRSGTVYILGNVLEASAWIAVASTASAPLAVALMFLAGILESTATAVFFAEAQVRIPTAFMGYYYAALIPFTDLCSFAGAAVGGVVAGHSLTAAALCTAALMAVPVLLTARWYYRPALGQSAEGLS